MNTLLQAQEAAAQTGTFDFIDAGAGHVVEFLAGIFGMAREIPAAPVVNTLDFLPPKWEEKLDILRGASVMG